MTTPSLWYRGERNLSQESALWFYVRLVETKMVAKGLNGLVLL